MLKPLPELAMHLLGADGQVLPAVAGQEGEMILAGDTVSPGYVGADGRSESPCSAWQKANFKGFKGVVHEV